MPTKPKRPCHVPRCPHFAGQCPVHPAPQGRSGWQQRPSSTVGQRTRGGKWMVMRAEVMREEACCYLCGASGRSDDIVDHVVPLSQGGTDARANRRRCCRKCSTQKTAQESTRARR